MPGCFSQAETLSEMRQMISAAMDEWKPGEVSIPQLADENAELKPELVQAIFRHCDIPTDQLDEPKRKKLKLVHLSAYVDSELHDKANRNAQRHGRKMNNVLADIITATYEHVAKSRGNPFRS